MGLGRIDKNTPQTPFQQLKANPYARYYFALTIITALVVVALIIASALQGPSPTTFFESKITQISLAAAGAFFYLVLPVGYVIYKRGSKPAVDSNKTASQDISRPTSTTTSSTSTGLSLLPRYDKGQAINAFYGIGPDECCLFRNAEDGDKVYFMINHIDAPFIAPISKAAVPLNNREILYKINGKQVHFKMVTSEDLSQRETRSKFKYPLLNQSEIEDVERQLPVGNCYIYRESDGEQRLLVVGKTQEGCFTTFYDQVTLHGSEEVEFSANRFLIANS